MSELEALFEDRLRRKNIRDGINEAIDIGNGTCKCCGNSAYILSAFNTEICESCCNKLMALSEDYEVEMPEIVDEEFISDLVGESWVYLDTKKLQDDADKNYGGDVKALLKVYKIAPVNMDLAGGRIELNSSAQKSGKTRVNQLMIDYDGSHGTEKVALNQVPDADGTLAPPRVKGKLIGGGQGKNLANVKTPASNAASASKVANQASISNSGVSQSAKKAVKVVSGAVTGDNGNFTFKVGDAEIKCVSNSNSDYSVFLNGKDKGIFPSNVNMELSKAKDAKAASEIAKKELAKNPQNYFDTFDGVSGGVISIPKYSIYKFAFDESSFEKDLSMCIVYDGKVTKSRFVIPKATNALTNKAFLMNGLTEYMESTIGKKYPVFIKKNNVFKTSLGNAVVELENMRGQELTLEVSWGNNVFKLVVPADSISSDLKRGQVEVKRLLMNNLDKMVNGFFESSLGYKGTPNFMRLEHSCTVDGKDVKIDAQFNSSGFENSSNGEVDFIIQIVVDGKKYPDMDGDTFTIRKEKDIRVFLESAAKELYNKYVKAGTMSNTGDGLTISAINKMNNPSKRAAFLSKVGDRLMEELIKNAQGNKVVLNNSTLELDMSVDKDGGVHNVKFTLTADDADEYSSLENYKDNLNAALVGYDWIIFTGAKEVGNDFVARYEVKKEKIPYFMDITELIILEGAYLLKMLGRKRISALNS